MVDFYQPKNPKTINEFQNCLGGFFLVGGFYHYI